MHGSKCPINSTRIVLLLLLAALVVMTYLPRAALRDEVDKRDPFEPSQLHRAILPDL